MHRKTIQLQSLKFQRWYTYLKFYKFAHNSYVNPNEKKLKKQYAIKYSLENKCIFFNKYYYKPTNINTLNIITMLLYEKNK